MGGCLAQSVHVDAFPCQLCVLIMRRRIASQVLRECKAIRIVRKVGHAVSTVSSYYYFICTPQRCRSKTGGLATPLLGPLAKLVHRLRRFIHCLRVFLA